MDDRSAAREEASVRILRSYLDTLPPSRARSMTMYGLSVVAVLICALVMRQAIFGIVPVSMLVVALVVSSAVLAGVGLLWNRLTVEKWSPEFSSADLHTPDAKRVMERLCRYGKHLHRAQRADGDFRAARNTMVMMLSLARTLRDVDFELSCEVAVTNTTWASSQRTRMREVDTDTYLRLAVPLQAQSASRSMFGPAVKFGMR